jgi:hypothetical protein
VIAKPLPKATDSSAAPSAKADPLPAAAEVPPPPADIPPELMVGPGHKHHVKLDVDKFHIETTPVMVSRRKLKTGLQSLKKNEQKKITMVLTGVIGGGLVIGLLVLIWAAATGKFSSPAPEVVQAPMAETSAKGPAVEKTENAKPAEVKPVQAAWPTSWKHVSLDTAVGDVIVTVLNPQRGARPPQIKADDNDSDVLIVRVNLQLRSGVKNKVPLTSWADEKLKKAVFLKDDDKEGKGNTFELLGQVPRPGDDVSAVGTERIQVRLIFEMPAKIPNTMYIALPGAAFGADGTMIAYQFGKDDVGNEKPSSSAAAPKPEAGKPDGGQKEGAK